MALKTILQAGNGSVHPFACPGCHEWLWASASPDARHQCEQRVPSVSRCRSLQSAQQFRLVKRLDGHESWPAVLPAAGVSPAPRHGAFGVSSGSFSCCTHGGPWTGCICRNPTAPTCTDRTFPFFPSTPWCCLLTGHQAAREGRQGVISAAVLLPPARVVGHSIGQETSATLTLI